MNHLNNLILKLKESKKIKEKKVKEIYNFF